MSFESVPLITSAEGLAPLIAAIEPSAEVCLDTEADSLHHYSEKICLLQFTIPSHSRETHQNFLVDPLARLDLKPLFKSLQNKTLLLHGSDYDLRLLKNDCNFTPRSIFDTMLAARLCNHSALGLDGLVNRYIGTSLDHGSQKADWSLRPLPLRMIKYAIEDTLYLPEIVAHLREELKNLGRTEWHRQQCSQLIQTCSITHERHPDDLWRIKGSFGFDRQSLAILRELWLWRDHEASDWDRPSFMICNNDKLLDLTRWAKENPHGNLAEGPFLSRRWPARRWKSLRDALNRGWSTPPENWPLPPPRAKRPPFNPLFAPRLIRLKAARDAMAKQLQLPPFILASNGMLEIICANPPKNLDDFRFIEKWLPWQTEVLGEAFLKAILQPASESTSLRGPSSRIDDVTETNSASLGGQNA